METSHQLMVLMSLLIYPDKTLSLDCVAGWFGARCQFMCHCHRSDCHEDGTCKNGSNCVKPYFGFACQYVDIPASDENTNPYLFDYDDTTCGNGGPPAPIEIFYSQKHSFTFARLVFGSHVTLPKIAFKLRHITLNFIGPASTHCSGRRIWRVDERTIDVHCFGNIIFTRISITGALVSNICSVYISQGRNVAVMQTTSCYPGCSGKITSLAVDGDTSQNDPNKCFILRHRRSWNVSFESPFVTSGVKLLLLKEDFRNPLYRNITFELRVTGDDNRVVMETNISRPYSSVYVIHFGTSLPSRILELKNIQKSFLKICELEAYGDCPFSNFGLDCKNVCRCLWHPCHVSGRCLQCVADNVSTNCWEAVQGLKREVMLTRRPRQADCLHCKDKLCDPKTKECQNECVDGFTGNKCNQGKIFGRLNDPLPVIKKTGHEELLPMTTNSFKIFSPTPSQPKITCTNCKGSGACRKKDGFCLEGCVEGYRGDVCILNCRNCAGNQACARDDGACLEGCIPGYKGNTCESKCTNCGGNQTCDRTSGKCHAGCMSGFKGLSCDKACSNCAGNGQCEFLSGTCLTGCKLGYSGHDCETVCLNCGVNYNCTRAGDCVSGCVAGYMGSNCMTACKHCAGDRSCDQFSGSCRHGCSEGFTGNKCDNFLEDEEGWFSGPGGVYYPFAAAGGLFVLVCLFCLFCYPYMTQVPSNRRDSKSSTEKQSRQYTASSFPSSGSSVAKSPSRSEAGEDEPSQARSGSASSGDSYVETKPRALKDRRKALAGRRRSLTASFKAMLAAGKLKREDSVSSED